jgi:hypothetical protein
MSIAKNTIRFSDITTTPIKLKYSSSFVNTNLAPYGITENKGVDIPVITSGSVSGTTIGNALRFRLMKQLYYNEYISGSLLLTGSAYDSSLQSTAASGSRDEDNRFFPTTNAAQIRFLAAPTRTFGENISRKSFVWTSNDGTSYKIVDDGNGNIEDAFKNYEHVGNIIYPQGIITVTNPNYLFILSNPGFTFTITSF